MGGFTANENHVDIIDELETSDPGIFGPHGGYSRVCAISSMNWMLGKLLGTIISGCEPPPLSVPFNRQEEGDVEIWFESNFEKNLQIYVNTLVIST